MNNKSRFSFVPGGHECQRRSPSSGLHDVKGLYVTTAMCSTPSPPSTPRRTSTRSPIRPSTASTRSGEMIFHF